jgi:ParB family chromosome partitioning protein
MGRFSDKFLPASEGLKTEGQRSASKSSFPVMKTGELSSQRDAAMERAESAEAELRHLTAELEEAKKQGRALEVALDDLVEVPGRRRTLSAEAYAELRENVRQHELITPITVRVLEGGKFEIISGHNRVTAYRELGRDKIKAWPADAGEDKIDELAFYANLLHPDLSAYEKYQGLKKISAQNPELSHEALADRVGLSRTLVTELLSFDNIPKEALAELEKRPGALGSKALIQLAAMAREGKVGAVVEAIRAAVLEGKTAQEVLQAATGGTKRLSLPRAEPIKIRAGRKNYCTMTAARNVVRIQFESEEERVEIEKEIRDFLESIAIRKKSH